MRNEVEHEKDFNDSIDDRPVFDERLRKTERGDLSSGS